MYARLKEGLKKVSGQLHMRNRNGEERWVEICCTTIFDDAGRAIKAIGISKDISAVSYTHLDVYKRQELVSPSAAIVSFGSAIRMAVGLL